MPPRSSTRHPGKKQKLDNSTSNSPGSSGNGEEDKGGDYEENNGYIDTTPTNLHEHEMHNGDMSNGHQQLQQMEHHPIGVGLMGMGVGGSAGMMGGDDGDNRTRNARAQRRHREKRKAMTAALEQAVQTLTSQLEEARRQLSQSFRANAISPGSREFSQLQAENAYLRDENADLRRQLYSHRVNYGHMPPPPPAQNGEDVKTESNGFAAAYGPGSSPRVDAPRRGGEYEQPQNGDTGNSAPSSSSSYPSHIDQFAPMNHRSRRVQSTGSAPNTSPYLASDPRSVEPRYPPIRYEPMYNGPPSNAPPPHNMPRSTSMYEAHQYTSREEGAGGQEGVSWPSESSGPPPFPSYPIGYPGEGQSEEWRSEH